jgi:hypothetical protein
MNRRGLPALRYTDDLRSPELHVSSAGANFRTIRCVKAGLA